VRKFRWTSKLILELRLTREGRTMLASSANRLPVLLETTVTPKGGSMCRSVFSSMLNGPPAH
jgi:hypothetical protein